MNTVYFRWQESEDVVDITFQFNIEAPPVNKAFNFKRPVEELVDTTLNRMKTNVDKEISKRSKVKKVKPKKSGQPADSQPGEIIVDGHGPPDDAIENLKVVLLNASGAPIIGITWTELFVTNPAMAEGAVLHVKNTDYALAFNSPYVARVEVPTSMMAGYDCFPSKLEFQFTSREECEYRWYKGLPKPNHENATKDIKWSQCGDQFIYEVKADDVGHKIKVK